MINLSGNVKKICSFYVSDLHLVTMLLPYINKRIDEKINITTLLEKDIIDYVKLLSNKITLSKVSKNKILNVNWMSTKLNSYEKAQEFIEENININNELTIIIKGANEYLKYANLYINSWIEKNKEKIITENIKLSVINCYETDQFKFIGEILKIHDKVLNTSGEKEIDEVFIGYENYVM